MQSEVDYKTKTFQVLDTPPPRATASVCSDTGKRGKMGD